MGKRHKLPHRIDSVLYKYALDSAGNYVRKNPENGVKGGGLEDGLQPGIEVGYSLNKKKRWNIPNVIKQTDQNLKTYEVTCLERHQIIPGVDTVAYTDTLGVDKGGRKSKGTVTSTKAYLDGDKLQATLKTDYEIPKKPRKRADRRSDDDVTVGMAQAPIIHYNMYSADNLNLEYAEHLMKKYHLRNMVTPLSSKTQPKKHSCYGINEMKNEFYDEQYSEEYNEMVEEFLADDSLDEPRSNATLSDWIVPSSARKTKKILLAKAETPRQEICKKDKIVEMRVEPEESKETPVIIDYVPETPADAHAVNIELQVDEFHYLETVSQTSASLPQRYILDITDDVRKALQSRFTPVEVCRLRTDARLVIEPLSAVTDKDTVFCAVWLNMDVNNANLLRIETVNPAEAYTVSSLVERVARQPLCWAADNFRDGDENWYVAKPPSKAPDATSGSGWLFEDAAAVCASQEDLAQEFAKQSDDDFVMVEMPQDAAEDDCSICTTAMKSLGADTALNWTSLNECSHRFCNACWATHLRDVINAQTVKVTCPAHNCNTVVPETVIAAILNMRFVLRHSALMKDYLVTSSSNMVRCSRKACQRALTITADTLESDCVRCICKFVFCVRCQGEGHYPATCAEAEEGRRLYKKFGLSEEDTDQRPLIISVKKCPSCHYPIMKGEGCNSMTCRCGTNFCWNCLEIPGGSCRCVEPKKEAEEVVFTRFTSTTRQQSFLLTAFNHRLARSNNSNRKFAKIASKLLGVKDVNKFNGSTEIRDKVNEVRSILNFRTQFHFVAEHTAMLVAVAMRPDHNSVLFPLQQLHCIVDNIDQVFMARIVARKEFDELLKNLNLYVSNGKDFVRNIKVLLSKSSA